MEKEIIRADIPKATLPIAILTITLEKLPLVLLLIFCDIKNEKLMTVKVLVNN